MTPDINAMGRQHSCTQLHSEYTFIASCFFLFFFAMLFDSENPRWTCRFEQLLPFDVSGDFSSHPLLSRLFHALLTSLLYDS